METFKEAMLPYKDNFVIIGGTACDIQLRGTAMMPRATEDIDIIVVVERLTQEFVNAFWQLIHKGNYRVEKRINQAGASVYALYRFTLQDEKFDYPQKIELLSRHSDLMGEPSGFHIEPIPTDELHQSLSAIIMDDDIYDFKDGVDAMRRGGFYGGLYESSDNAIDDSRKLSAIKQISSGEIIDVHAAVVLDRITSRQHAQRYCDQ